MLREMAASNSTKAMAKALNLRFGGERTRNSVIGICRREGIPLGGASSLPAVVKRPRPAKAKPPKAALAPPQRAPRPVLRPSGPPYALRQLTGRSCRWIAGDPRHRRPFACEDPRIPHSPYCETHTKLSRQPRMPSAIKPPIDRSTPDAPLTAAQALGH